jgi:hypothetical protein
VVAWYKAQAGGRGYQTLMNTALREAMRGRQTASTGVTTMNPAFPPESPGDPNFRIAFFGRMGGIAVALGLVLPGRPAGSISKNLPETPSLNSKRRMIALLKPSAPPCRGSVRSRR